jgi:hypothetical protein
LFNSFLQKNEALGTLKSDSAVSMTPLSFDSAVFSVT